VLQCGAFHEFHRDERAPAIFSDFVDGANVGMLDAAVISAALDFTQEQNRNNASK
jgi:hypothetical protein